MSIDIRFPDLGTKETILRENELFLPKIDINAGLE